MGIRFDVMWDKYNHARIIDDNQFTRQELDEQAKKEGGDWAYLNPHKVSQKTWGDLESDLHRLGTDKFIEKYGKKTGNFIDIKI